MTTLRVISTIILGFAAAGSIPLPFLACNRAWDRIEDMSNATTRGYLAILAYAAAVIALTALGAVWFFAIAFVWWTS